MIASPESTKDGRNKKVRDKMREINSHRLDKKVRDKMREINSHRLDKKVRDKMREINSQPKPRPMEYLLCY